MWSGLSEYSLDNICGISIILLFLKILEKEQYIFYYNYSLLRWKNYNFIDNNTFFPWKKNMGED